MSNIKLTKDILLGLNDILKGIDTSTLKKNQLEEILNLLIPTSNSRRLVEYRIVNQGITTASFIPQTRTIKASVNKVMQWLDSNTKNDFKRNIEEERKYWLLFILSHETEHVYQYFMGKGVLDCPNEVLKDIYDDLFSIISPEEDIIPRPIKETRERIARILYRMRKDQEFSLLERNANIESMAFVSQVALNNNREDIATLFANNRDLYLKCGYFDSCKGNVEETYKKILMLDRYRKIYRDPEISEEEKVRYGFEIKPETRKILMSKKY